jgi:1-acyl-sn-glycerol-3-phosphate acyltransferase
VVGRLMGLLGAWPLQLERSGPAAIRRTLQWLRDGGVVTIFPEGGRALPDGSMSRFKPGAVRMALEANVPILAERLSLPTHRQRRDNLSPAPLRHPARGRGRAPLRPPRKRPPLRNHWRRAKEVDSSQ